MVGRRRRSVKSRSERGIDCGGKLKESEEGKERGLGDVEVEVMMQHVSGASRSRGDWSRVV